MAKKFDEFKIPNVTILGGSNLAPKELVERMKNINKYNKSEVVAIFNYHSFLYGASSAFPFPLPEILVIDDASDFEIVRNEFGSIMLDRFEKTHKNCYDAIITKLSEYPYLYPNISDFQRSTSDPRTVELVLFPHQKDIFDIIDNYRNELNEEKGKRFYYPYRRNKDNLNSSLIFISQYDIEIRPFIIPEEKTPLKNIPQVFFMSATLPKIDLLHKIFGIDEAEINMLDESKLNKETYESIKTMGSRLIFPLSQEYAYKSISVEGLNGIKELYNIHNKILIMVNSNEESRQIINFLTRENIPYILYKSADDGFTFGYETTHGCLICVNRFLGLDFPGDTCKVGVIAKLPLIWDSMDRFQISILNNDDYKEERLGNRLVQALGRLNRLETDESIYYILDSAILNKIINPIYHEYYPVNIFSEIMAGARAS
jgi:hypothetical protein